MKKRNTGLSGRFIIVLFLTFSFWQNNLVAQEGSFYKGARAWKTISSLIGESLENAKIILKNDGLVLFNNSKDTSTGIEAYNFVRANDKNPESEIPYTIGIIGNKVDFLMIPYEYADTINIPKDIDKLKEQLKTSGYNLTDEKTKEHNGMGVTWTESKYYFNKPNQSKEVRIYRISKDSFYFVFGEKKILALMEED